MIIRKFILGSIVFAAVAAPQCHAAKLPKSALIFGKVEIGRTTFRDIQKWYGGGKAVKQDPSEEAPVGVCFLINGQIKTRVVFESGSAGAWKRITGVRLTKASPGDVCPVWRGDGFANGVLLGQDRRTVEAKLGIKAMHKSDSLHYVEESRRPATPAERAWLLKNFPSEAPQFDVTIAVDANFKHEKLTEFYLTKTDTF